MIANQISPSVPRINKRVLAVVRHPVGGVRTHIVYTYPLLHQAGYRFTFVIPDHESCDAFQNDVASWQDAEIVSVPSRDRGQNPSKPIFRSTVRRLLKEKRFSLIHSHGLQAAIPSIFANIGINIPHIMTSQDVFHHVDFSGTAERLKLFALGQLLRRLEVLIAVSEDTRVDHLRYLPALRKGPCRVEMIHNGIPLEKFKSTNGVPPSSLREQFSLDDDVCLIGFLGRFMEQKGFLVLVEALAQLVSQGGLKPFHLVAVGSGDMLVNYKRELVKKPDVASCLSFLDHTPSPVTILRELDLLVMPSLWEAHPLLPMETMLVGTPVLGTNCLGLREVLRDSPSRMVPPGDANELALALRRAIASPWKDAAMEYIPKAKERFDVRQTAEQLAMLFDKLIV